MVARALLRLDVVLDIYEQADPASALFRLVKESSCGCAGCFNAPTALGSYATVFEEMNALQHFEAFCSVNGPQFYGCLLYTSRCV